MFIRKRIEWLMVPQLNYSGSRLEPFTVYEVKHVEHLLLDAFGREQPAKRVTVIRWGGLGDIVILSAAMRAFKKKYPGVFLLLVTSDDLVPILKGTKAADGVVGRDDIQKFEHHAIVDLRWKVEAARTGGRAEDKTYDHVPRLQIFKHCLGVEDVEAEPDISVNRFLAMGWSDILGIDHSKKIVVLQATTTSRIRTIPPGYVQELAETLSLDHWVILIGRPHECLTDTTAKISGKNIINLISEPLTPTDVVAVASLADVIIAPNSALAAIAWALNKKGVVIFGNTDPSLRVGGIGMGGNLRALFPLGELACVPCNDIIQCSTPKGWAQCMELLTPSRVIQEMSQLS